MRGGAHGTVIGTYLHGPLLPKNASFADWLIAHGARASRRRRWRRSTTRSRPPRTLAARRGGGRLSAPRPR